MKRDGSKIAIAFGTFDILHPGHISYLRQAKKFGETLIVIIARDITVSKLKKRAPVFSEHERRQIIESLSFVDKAILGSATDHFQAIRKIHPAVICLGYDHKMPIGVLRKSLARMGMADIRVVRAKAFRKSLYKSSRYRTSADHI